MLLLLVIASAAALPVSPDQGIMLSIISGLVPNSIPDSWTSSNPVCNWKGVECTNALVTSVSWSDLGLYGSINLAVLPPNIVTFDVSDNYLASLTISWVTLPVTLTGLYLNGNYFQGTIDVSALPVNMQNLDVSENLFSGTPNFASLPSQLSLSVGRNNFCGTMINAQQVNDVSAMCVGGSDPTQGNGQLSCPSCDPKQQTSDLVSLLNAVSGIVNKHGSWLPSVPACSWSGVTCRRGVVTKVDWSSRQLRGSLNMTLPRFTASFAINQNSLTALGMTSLLLPAALTTVDLSTNLFQGPIDVSSLPDNMQSFYINDNLFSGTPNFASLPSQLSLSVGRNNFCGTMINAQQVNDVSAMCVGGSDPTQANGKTVCPACDPKQQTNDLAALLIAVSGISNKDGSWSPSISACSWAGVTCRRGVVTKVNWNSMALTGALNLTLPRFTSWFSVSQNLLSSLSMSSLLLPTALTYLDLSNNYFVGPIDLLSLPTNMQSMYISDNFFSGTPNFKVLPAQLSLSVGQNNFCGAMSNAPQLNDVSAMCVGGSDPTQGGGQVVCPACDPAQQASDLSALLSSVSGITNKDGSWSPTVPSCSWAGITCRRGVVTKIDWSSMRLLGTLNVTLPRFTSNFNFHANAGTAVLSWKNLPSFITGVDLSQNFMSGTPDLASLPASLTSLDLSTNDFCGTMTQPPSGVTVYTSGMCIGNTDPTIANSQIVCPAC